jgi:hypothetical protein
MCSSSDVAPLALGRAVSGSRNSVPSLPTDSDGVRWTHKGDKKIYNAAAAPPARPLRFRWPPSRGVVVSGKLTLVTLFGIAAVGPCLGGGGGGWGCLSCSASCSQRSEEAPPAQRALRSFASFVLRNMRQACRRLQSRARTGSLGINSLC